MKTRPKILIIEDDTSLAWSLKHVLHVEGYNVETALTAEDTREVFLNKLGMTAKDETGVWRPTVAEGRP